MRTLIILTRLFVQLSGRGKITSSKKFSGKENSSSGNTSQDSLDSSRPIVVNTYRKIRNSGCMNTKNRFFEGERGGCGPLVFVKPIFF